MPHFHYRTYLSWLFASNYHIEINIINYFTNKKRKKEEYTPSEQLQNIIDVETAIK